MSAVDKLYLLLVVGSIGGFAVALAYQSWRWSRMSEPRAQTKSSQGTDTRVAPGSVHA